MFLRTRAPIRGFAGASAIACVVRRLERAAINAPIKSAHQFRHGLATQMPVASYRDNFRLLLKFAHQRVHTPPARLSLEAVDAR